MTDFIKEQVESIMKVQKIGMITGLKQGKIEAYQSMLDLIQRELDSLLKGG